MKGVAAAHPLQGCILIFQDTSLLSGLFKGAINQGSAPDKVENLFRHVRESSKLTGNTQELTANKIYSVIQSSDKGECIVL